MILLLDGDPVRVHVPHSFLLPALRTPAFSSLTAPFKDLSAGLDAQFATSLQTALSCPPDTTEHMMANLLTATEGAFFSKRIGI